MDDDKFGQSYGWNAEMEEQQEAASRRVREADERIGELTAHYEALGLRDSQLSAEIATLSDDFARERDEHFSVKAELTAKLTSEQELAARNWDERCRFHAELLEATVRGEQVAAELIATHQILAHLESALRQRQEETEQTHKALGEADVREAELIHAIAAGTDREATLSAKLALSEDRVTRLSAQRYSALADARSARSQVDRMAICLWQTRNEAQIHAGEMQDNFEAAQVAEMEAIEAEQILSERLSHRESQMAELESLLVRTQSDLEKHAAEKSVLVGKLADRQFEVEEHQRTVEWLRQVHVALESIPFWWRFLHPSRRRRLENIRLLRRGLF